MNQKLSIVIPAFNELKNFQKGSLEQIDNYLKKENLSWPVFIVDDGSTDNSIPKIENFIKNKKNWTLIKNPHLGKAGTVATGVKLVKTPYVLFSDFDQATPISEVEKLLPFLDKEYQVVIGSREVKGSLRQKEPALRHLMGKVFNLFVKIIAVRGIQDTQCGFKLFDTKTANKLFDRLVVYKPKKEKHAFTGAFDVELLFIASKWGVKIAEVPVHWKHSPTDRINAIRDSIRMFLDLIFIRLSDLLGKYKKQKSHQDEA